MKITSFKIRNYRTIRDEVALDVEGGLTLVGPNSSGKTNIAKAMQLFFTGYDNNFNYQRSSDIPHGKNAEKTSITAVFRQSDHQGDQDIYDLLDSLRDLLKLPQREDDELTVYLYFTERSKPVYRVFPNTKRPTVGSEKAAYSRREQQLIETLINQFVIHYIPSEKSFRDLYDDLLLPFLLRTSFERLRPNLRGMKEALDATAETVNSALAQAGLENLKASFAFPEHPEKILGQVEFQLSDPLETSIFRKGMGIQSAALLAAFHWITEQETAQGKNVVWLLEEPESYLHPELSTNCVSLISQLAKKSLVIKTTHSLSFVPQDPMRIVGTELSNGATIATKYKTYVDATNRIRSALGVRFSDFYNLGHYNVLVEGETDRIYLQWILKLTSINGDLSRKWLTLRSRGSAIMDFGGVKFLEGFLRATYSYISAERAAVAMFDGDKAGIDARSSLQGYFGNKNIQFQPRHHFVSVRTGFAIEGLFPDEWIVDLYSQHASWFSSFSVDASGALEPFSLADAHKKSFLHHMIAKADAEPNFDWAKRWFDVLDALDAALHWQSLRLYGQTGEMPPLEAEPILSRTQDDTGSAAA